MLTTGKIEYEISRIIDIGYLLKFLFLFFLLYYFDWLYWGVIVEGGDVYFPFFAKYGNYTNFLTKSILYVSEQLTQIFGLNTFISNGNTLRVINGSAVWMQRPCVGLVLVFFWLSFIIAHKSSWKKKLFWTISGAVVIITINVIRVTMLLFALQNNWPNYTTLNHHDLFKYVCFLIIFIMILLFNKSENQFNKLEKPI